MCGEKKAALPALSPGEGSPPLCGEKSRALRVWRYSWGSPPYTRGKEALVQSVILGLGITPAYAGKRGCGRTSSAVWWDHPRIRGEKTDENQTKLEGVGSPPHTRGKGLPAPRPRRHLGITPAYAGKSSLPW